MINGKARDDISSLVQSAVDEGAEVVTGATVPDRTGYYYTPTVLGRVAADAEILQQEIFGPVAPVVTFESDDEAIALANDTPYGLASYLYTGDLARGLRLAEAIESGMVGVNRGRSDRQPPSEGSNAPGSAARAPTRVWTNTWRPNTSPSTGRTGVPPKDEASAPFADSDPHFDDVEIPFEEVDDYFENTPPVLFSSFEAASEYGFERVPPGWVGSWHPAPQRVLAIYLSGELEIEASDGSSPSDWARNGSSRGGHNRQGSSESVTSLRDGFHHPPRQGAQ